MTKIQTAEPHNAGRNHMPAVKNRCRYLHCPYERLIVDGVTQDLCEGHTIQIKAA